MRRSENYAQYDGVGSSLPAQLVWLEATKQREQPAHSFALARPAGLQ